MGMRLNSWHHYTQAQFQLRTNAKNLQLKRKLLFISGKEELGIRQNE